LTKTAFESNIEAGVLLEDSQVDEVKSFFNTSLWKNAKHVENVRKHKKLWNAEEKSRATRYSNKNKTHTKIKEWTDDYVSTWYFAVPDKMSKKAERKIKKETNWATKLLLVGDIGPGSFKQLKLGDFAFIVNLKKRQGKIEVELARIFDKSRVETDEGDLHFAYETKKTYLIERNRFYEMLENATIGPKSWEIPLNEYQVKLIAKTLSSSKSRKTM
jgi:hypothetical protein